MNLIVIGAFPKLSILRTLLNGLGNPHLMLVVVLGVFLFRALKRVLKYTGPTFQMR
jgi:hypothetical protein